MVGSSIAANLAEIQARIRAAKSSSSYEGDVKLIAVTKTKPLDMIDEAVAAGQLDFGENYVQEAIVKADARPKLNWHFIGALQTNKVRDVVGRFGLIHSVDRVKLAREIDKVAIQKKLRQDVLLEVRIGGEGTKHGASPEELPVFARECLALPGLRLRGLMSLPPLSEDAAASRAYFREVRELALHLKRDVLGSAGPEFDILSMGTTSDFEAAIIEGATHVRIGTAIFGERHRHNA